MLVEFTVVEKYIKNQCTKLLSGNNKKVMQVVAHIYNQHNIPAGDIMDMLTMKKAVTEYSEFWIFCVVEALDYVNKTKYTQSFFAQTEIDFYSKRKLKTNEQFPIIIQCHQVRDNQWIGCADVNFFIDLRDNQILRYNENAQRVMKRIIRGETTSYKIAVNQVAVKEIQKSMEEGVYIPDDITLNIPVEPDSDFYYNEKKGVLVINHVTYLDIGDGYHRLLAMFRAKQENPDFNYPMELRITHFPEDIAKQFIFQKDQKTKMTKLDSNSMNMNDPANIVTERLNADPLSCLKGMISRNQGNIDFIALSRIIHTLYFKGGLKRDERIQTNLAFKEIRDKINYIYEQRPDILSRKLIVGELCILMYMVRNYDINQINQILLKLDDIISQQKIGDRLEMTRTGLKQAVFNHVKTIIEKECDFNV